MTAHTEQQQNRRQESLLTDKNRTKILGLATRLLLDENGQFKPNTFLTNAEGEIRGNPERSQIREHSGSNLCWPALTIVAQAYSTPQSTLTAFCRQSHREAALTFSEKGHFMRRVVLLASKTYEGEYVPHRTGKDIHAVLSVTEKDSLLAAIPPQRGRTSIGRG